MIDSRFRHCFPQIPESVSSVCKERERTKGLLHLIVHLVIHLVTQIVTEHHRGPGPVLYAKDTNSDESKISAIKELIRELEK